MLHCQFHPKILPRSSFCIINTDVATSPGTHWILVARRDDQFYFVDSFDKNIDHYKSIRFNELLEYLIDKNLQKMDLIRSLLYLFCLYSTLKFSCKSFVVDD